MLDVVPGVTFGFDSWGVGNNTIGYLTLDKENWIFLFVRAIWHGAKLMAKLPIVLFCFQQPFSKPHDLDQHHETIKGVENLLENLLHIFWLRRLNSMIILRGVSTLISFANLWMLLTWRLLGMAVNWRNLYIVILCTEWRKSGIVVYKWPANVTKNRYIQFFGTWRRIHVDISFTADQIRIRRMIISKDFCIPYTYEKDEKAMSRLKDWIKAKELLELTLFLGTEQSVRLRKNRPNFCRNRRQKIWISNICQVDWWEGLQSLNILKSSD